MFFETRNIVFALLISFLWVPICSADRSVQIANDKFDQDRFRSVLRVSILDSYKDEEGVHIESALSALGALSGFALQQGIRKVFIEERGNAEDQVFNVIETKNGQKYYFGSIFDQPLYDTRKDQISVWTLVGGAAQKAGATSLPDINAMAKANAAAIGTARYGKLTVPLNHQPIDSPLDAIRKHWGFTQKLLRAKEAEPQFWSWEIALVAQDLILLGNNVIPLEIAAQIVMESAISMSKINPQLIQ